jgi:hypothetical protein
MDGMVCGDLLDWPVATNRLHGYPGLEDRAVGASLTRFSPPAAGVWIRPGSFAHWHCQLTGWTK